MTQKLKPLLLVCAIISIAARAGAQTKLGEAPQPPPWPSDLPPAIEIEGGIFLPTALENAILERLLFLDGYPALCTTAIHSYADYVAAQWKAQLDVERARRQAAELEEAAAAESAWRWYHVAGGVAGALVVGLGAGYVAGAY